MKLAIIGAGYVGLVTGLCLTDLGHEVWFLDVDKDKIALLKRGKLPLKEPGLARLLARARRKDKVHFSVSAAEVVSKSKIWFVCVGTPSAADGSCNISFVLQAIKTILSNASLNQEGLIVVKSTVDPLKVSEIEKMVRGRLRIAFVPEFLSEGTAVKDFFSPARLVWGVKGSASIRLLEKIYQKIKAPRVVCSPSEAVLIKCASNVFLASKISFANLWALFCDKVGADINLIMKGIGLDPRISKKFLAAGLGFGGSCFPKDVRAARVYFQRAGVRSSFFHEVLAINKTMVEWVVEKVKELGKKRVAVWGLTFKPNTDDLRESQAVALLKRLNRLGLEELRACDPAADWRPEGEWKRVKFSRDPYLAAKGMDIIILATEWDIFIQADFEKVARLMRSKIIIDGRSGFQLLDKGRLEELGFQYLGVAH